MRSILVLGFLVALSSSADAATLHHAGTWHHLFMNPNVASSFDAAPGWDAERVPPSLRYDDAPPSYNDPSKSGGSAALPIEN
jgi:hypothetical protein